MDNMIRNVSNAVGAAMKTISGLSVSNCTIKVSSEVLLQKSTEVTNQVKRIKGYFEELRNLLEKTEAYWISERGDGIRQEYISKQDEITRIVKRLEEHPIDLVNIAQNYSATELKIQETIQSLPTAL